MRFRGREADEEEDAERGGDRRHVRRRRPGVGPWGVVRRLRRVDGAVAGAVVGRHRRRVQPGDAAVHVIATTVN